MSKSTDCQYNPGNPTQVECDNRIITAPSAASETTGLDSVTTEAYRKRLRIRGTQRRLPQALIIGVRKCGTRALLEMLNLHPHIQKNGMEMHFFDEDERYANGLEWYRKKMPYSFDNQVQPWAPSEGGGVGFSYILQGGGGRQGPVSFFIPFHQVLQAYAAQ